MFPIRLTINHGRVNIRGSAFDSGRIKAEEFSRSKNLITRLAPAPLLGKSGQNLRAFDPECAR